MLLNTSYVYACVCSNTPQPISDVACQTCVQSVHEALLRDLAQAWRSWKVTSVHGLWNQTQRLKRLTQDQQNGMVTWLGPSPTTRGDEVKFVQVLRFVIFSTKELTRSVFTQPHVTRLRFVCRSRSMPDLNYTLNGIVKEGKKAADSTNRNSTSISCYLPTEIPLVIAIRALDIFHSLHPRQNLSIKCVSLRAL